MDNLVMTIEPALYKISELFCVSVDYLKENFMNYALMYGKYSLVDNIFTSIIVISLIFLTFTTIYTGVYYSCFVDWSYDDEEEKKKKQFFKKSIKVIAYSMLSIMAAFALFNIALYVISPEIYSLKAILRLMK